MNLLDTDSLVSYDQVVFVEVSFVEPVVMRVVDEEAFSGIWSMTVYSGISLVAGLFKGLTLHC